MKKIKINKNLTSLKKLADKAFFEWDLIDKEYPYASFKRWIRARKTFEAARDIYFEFLKKEKENESINKIFS